MRPISVAFSRVKVLIIGQDNAVKERLRDMLTGFGVPTRQISECQAWKTHPPKPLNGFDLVIFDCDQDRFSRDLVLNDLAGEDDDDQTPAPVALIAEDDVKTIVTQAFGDKKYTVIGHSFCAKSLYLQLHLLIAQFKSSLTGDRTIQLDEAAPGDAAYFHAL